MKKLIKSGGLLDLQLRLWGHLSRRRQRQFVLLSLLMLVSAFAEIVSLGLVLPFLGVLVSPERVFKYATVAQFAQSWGIISAQQLVLPLTLVFAAAALAAGATRLLVLWLSTRLAYASGADLSNWMYRRTLYQPYWKHVSRNSGEVISTLVNSVNGASGVMLSALTLVSSAVLLIAVMLALMAIDPTMAIIATIGFGGIYRLIVWMSRRRLELNSTRITVAHGHVIKALQEGLGGIRDVLLDGTQPLYCDVYRQADQQLRLAHGNNLFIIGSPRFVMESIGMVLLAALAYAASLKDGGVASALPALGALALGAQRLLPALQQVYGSWASITGSQASLVNTVEMLEQPIPDELQRDDVEPLPLRDALRFEAVSFRYAADGPWVLNELNFTIRKGARVGFVGSTGSGKSTTFDLLMGLLEPTKGYLVVDGRPLTGARVRAWQKSIAHVPQSIYLADATLAENIAFGVPRQSIDLGRVRWAARQAQIADTIESRAEGYDALVGERGIRLSGGQRQRIGIARALYKQASVLVFDEATSALDNSTEQSVMEAIDALSRDLTVLLIAHRLSTVRRCDSIIELDHGRAVACGSYEDLLQSSASFRRMAHAVS